MRQRRAPGLGVVHVASVLILSLPAHAQDEEPSLDFLEYLGSWEDDDEAWYVEVQMEETDGDATEDADNAAPKTTRVEHEDD